MLALIDFEAQQCTGCGGFLPDTTDPDTQWEAEPPHRCRRCDAMLTMQKKVTNTDPKKGPTTRENPEALRVWPVQRKG